jgi:2-dehydro-3-deoxyphosphooctonate aldolase (KDO 8-P synthase)
MKKTVDVGGVALGAGRLAVVAGPCALESPEDALRIARAVSAAGVNLGVGVIFKGSYSKDNRSSVSSYRGPGLEVGLDILRRVREQVGIPVLTDVHTPQQVEAVAESADMVQIPAFLSRQTSLVMEAGSCGKPLNIKKAQFMAPQDIKFVVEKAEEAGCSQMMLTERGSFHGFHRLVVDMRSIPIMGETGYPVCFDVTHSLQAPGGSSTRGEREWAPVLAKAALAAGCDCLFMEVHPDPSASPSDKETILPLDGLEAFLEPLVALSEWLGRSGSTTAGRS